MNVLNTPEEMSSQCEDPQNESNEDHDEDEVQCLEVYDPEIHILRNVFGDENMLL